MTNNKNFSKVLKNKVNGVLLLNKPIGISSNTALQKVKRLFNAEKCGHTGTLDPLASGLLPICFGEATKFTSFLLDGDKEYIATIRLGVETDTYDTEGKVVVVKNVSLDSNLLLDCVNSFLGTILQTPPIYSALKIDGRPLYDYARSGNSAEIDISTKTREVTLYELEVLDYVTDKIFTNEYNTFRLRVKCSKGTYIRSLAHDIGQKLLCGAYLVDLVRTKTNSFNLNLSLDLNHLEELCYNDRLESLLKADVLVKDLPRLDLLDAEFALVRHGHSFWHNGLGKRSNVLCKNLDNLSAIQQLKCAIYFKDVFLGVAVILNNNLVQPVRLVNCGYLEFFDLYGEK